SGGWKASPSTNSAPSLRASAEPTSVLPQPETPITITGGKRSASAFALGTSGVTVIVTSVRCDAGKGASGEFMPPGRVRSRSRYGHGSGRHGEIECGAQLVRTERRQPFLIEQAAFVKRGEYAGIERVARADRVGHLHRARRHVDSGVHGV